MHRGKTSPATRVPMTRKVVCFGEILLRLSAPGKELLLQTARLDVHVGGAEANVAVSLSRLGQSSTVVSVLPDNPIGRACCAELRRNGVDTAAIQFSDGRMGLYFLTHGAGMRPAEVLYDRSDSAFALASPDAFDWQQLLANALWLHVSGITPAVSARGAESAMRAMTCAAELGVHVSFDCNFRTRLWGARKAEAPDVIRALCLRTNLLFGEARDIAFVLGTALDRQERAGADAAFNAFPSLRAMAHTTRSVHAADVQHLAGVLHLREGATFRSRTHALHGIVDRIGAGDAFAAGVLHGLQCNHDPQRIVDFATAAGCMKHTIPGTERYPLAKNVEAIGHVAMAQELAQSLRR
jgi:2-dehydro-3-deoxygluconokinase